MDPKYFEYIPKNVNADISATTVFGNKYISFSSPKDPTPQRITTSDVIDVTSVTTEFNTLFETVVDVAEQVDPIKLNQTLSATAEALDGLGDRFGQSIIQGNEILADINPQMPQIRRDNQLLADLGDVYANAAPDLFDGLENAVTTARTLNEQQGNIDQALMAAVGFGNTGGDIFERGGPYLVRGAAGPDPHLATARHVQPGAVLHDPQLPRRRAQGRRVAWRQRLFAADASRRFIGAANPYVYPDNLPRVNARGGPEGRPGCWQPITRDLWPAPYLVMDTGASIAPYNHFELGPPFGLDLYHSPLPAPIPLSSRIEYIWGRQIGENTINP